MKTPAAFICAWLWLSAYFGPECHGADFSSQRAELLSKQGEALYSKIGSPQEAAAALGQFFLPGDRLRTLELSRATVRFSDASQFTMKELTTLDILAPPVQRKTPALDLKAGFLYFFSREQPREIQIRTRHAVGGTRGTEFLVEVETDRTVFTVFDGEIELTNLLGRATAKSGQRAIAERDKAPEVRPILQAERIVQWWLYYPGVLNVDEVPFSDTERNELAASIIAYRSGDLLEALARLPGYPRPREPASDAERIYQAALMLAVGKVERTEQFLGQVKTASSLVSALRLVLDAVGNAQENRAVLPTTASEWLGLSYYRQAQFDLAGALVAAQRATDQSPDFGFAWARVAELQFSFGRIPQAKESLVRALSLAPRNAQGHALRGFLLSAENRIDAAMAAFEEAIRIDGALANAWLGRGLCRIRRGQAEAGRADLQTAAALEPNRAVLHSYLGKAFNNAGDDRRAEQELKRALALDPKDPTPWLYEALLHHQQNRINEAVEDLEKSLESNDNRQVYRSRLLLDQDRAVRSSSLAKIYRDAGMTDVSVREAARAVSYDYANYSAHLFLADSFDALRDPTRFNLRYETVWFNELLLANLLSPVGAGTLSQHVSQQEYSKLFEADRFGLNTTTEYVSDGQFREITSQFGTVGNTSYALDLEYQHNNGSRPNSSLSRLEWYSQIKQQLTPQDSVFVLTKYQDYASGDNFQYYDPSANARPDFRLKEFQTPILVGAYHREWSPGVHTLLLGGRLINEQELTDKNLFGFVTGHSLELGPNGFITRSFVDSPPVDELRYRSEFEIYTGEINQIFQGERHTVVFGGRFQSGQFTTTNLLASSATLYPDGPRYFADPAAAGEAEDNFARFSIYGYDTWELRTNLLLTAGLTYDHLNYPENFRLPPIQQGQAKRDRFSPKAAIVWSPRPEVTLRGIYSRALGGVSYDESFRLEPTQLAGFNQAFRTIISESEVGSIAAPTYEVLGGAIDLKLKTRTYVGLDAQFLNSKVRRTIGLFDFEIEPPATPSSTREHLDYREQSVGATFNQLLGEEWSLGAQYRFTSSRLQDTFPSLDSSLKLNRELRADLHQVNVFALFNHRSGFFGRAELRWYGQNNSGYDRPLPGDEFMQINLYLGYRFWRQRGEITFGGLNLTDADYRLNPLNVYSELPRTRVFYTRLRLNF